MTIPKLGEIVEFELNPDGQPRWQYKKLSTGMYVLSDTGYSDNIIEGVVSGMDDAGFTMQIWVNAPELVGNYVVATQGHQAYEADQWRYPGFPKARRAAQADTVCTCGAWSMYGRKNCPGHYPSCDLYSPNPYTGV